jgi:AbrB family transcriptional regulator (stage V sporulation protein T)
MKATGIVRRIDDLGRIVIPKEIRRTMRIREGDPMEIFTNREGEILLKKYSPVGELSEFASILAESMAQVTGESICITDKDYVVAAAGPGKKDLEGKPIDAQLQAVIDKRENPYTESAVAFIKITPDDGKEYLKQAAATILCNGDCIGSVVICVKRTNTIQEDSLRQLARTMATFLGKQMEQ